ncbi:glutamate receptor ionotropic, kainate 2-like [Oratosquilla oratoria]|uniref:glutamate receptor ionotropic, kainate 2-like n=1 Tax=Oratosquilla oratoria TaxID=337810 RepID=UPI003F7649EC
MVNQGGKWWPKGVGSRAITSTVMLFCLLIYALYSGSITAFLAIPFKSKPIDSMDDLADSKMIPAVRSAVSVYNFFMQREHEGSLGEVKTRLEQFPGSYITTWDFFKDVESGKYALVDTMSSAAGRSMQYETQGQLCRFHVGKNIVYGDLDVFAFARNSPIRPPIDETLKWLRYFGILFYVKGRVYTAPCQQESKAQGPQPLGLDQAQGAFYVLALGLGAAQLALALEVLLAKVDVFSRSGDEENKQ